MSKRVIAFFFALVLGVLPLIGQVSGQSEGMGYNSILKIAENSKATIYIAGDYCIEGIVAAVNPYSIALTKVRIYKVSIQSDDFVGLVTVNRNAPDTIIPFGNVLYYSISN